MHNIRVQPEWSFYCLLSLKKKNCFIGQSSRNEIPSEWEILYNAPADAKVRKRWHDTKKKYFPSESKWWLFNATRNKEQREENDRLHTHIAWNLRNKNPTECIRRTQKKNVQMK